LLNPSSRAKIGDTATLTGFLWNKFEKFFKSKDKQEVIAVRENCLSFLHRSKRATLISSRLG
jgi:hypothetical protein